MMCHPIYVSNLRDCLPALLSKDAIDCIKEPVRAANWRRRHVDVGESQLVQATQDADDRVACVVEHRQELALGKRSSLYVVSRINHGQRDFATSTVHGNLSEDDVIVAAQSREPQLRAIRAERCIDAVVSL